MQLYQGISEDREGSASASLGGVRLPNGNVSFAYERQSDRIRHQVVAKIVRVVAQQLGDFIGLRRKTSENLSALPFIHRAIMARDPAKDKLIVQGLGGDEGDRTLDLLRIRREKRHLRKTDTGGVLYSRLRFGEQVARSFSIEARIARVLP
jgi:hypothetical protein